MVDDGQRIAFPVGDIQPRAGGVDGHAGGRPADLDRAEGSAVPVEDRDGVAIPVGDEHPAVARADRDAERPGARRRLADHREVRAGALQDADAVRLRVGDVDAPRLWPDRHPSRFRADLDRFRRELGVDYLDVVLIHCVTEDNWTTRYRGVMDVLSEAKQKGVIRAHGVSCHSLGALRAAAASSWVEVDLVRLNPVGAHMDADPATVIEVIRQMRSSGKAIVGMKILGQGAMRDRPSEALHYALASGVLDAFTIGAESGTEQRDLVRRIAAA